MQHRRVRRHGEEVLRETVVDFARDTGTFVRDCTAELREADRAPDADEQERVREHPQEVGARDRALRENGCEPQTQKDTNA